MQTRNNLYDIFYKGKNIPPAKDIEIEKAEEIMGKPIPFHYKKLLQTQNGGTCEFSYLKDAEDEAQLFCGVGDVSYRLEAPKGLNDFYPRTIVVFATDGHIEFCFDYENLNEEGEPTIVAIDHELDYFETIYDSFLDFLKDLSLPDYGETE